jgi:hypothetical protein
MHPVKHTYPGQGELYVEDQSKSPGGDLILYQPEFRFILCNGQFEANPPENPNRML